MSYPNNALANPPQHLVVHHAAANSETALRVLRSRVLADQYDHIKMLIDKGIASVRVDDGYVMITYDWDKPEALARQGEMQFDG